MNEDLQGSDKLAYSPKNNYKLAFLVSAMLTFLFILIDSIFSKFFMATSVQLSLFLQTLNLTAFCLFMSYVVFFAIFAYVLFIYTIRKDIQNNLIMIIGVCLMVYAQALIKLILVDSRPIFLHADLNDDFCICDYGKPSGHSLCSVGVLLFIYDDLKKHYSLSAVADWLIKASFVIISIFIGLSRIYLAAHSYNQVILGFLFGITLFNFVRRVEDELCKFIIWPVIFKERFKGKKAIFHILSLLLALNYILYYLWAYRHTKFENIGNDFFRFSNCFECFSDFHINFSVKILKEGLLFNLMFGMLLGVYLMSGPIYEFQGLYFDQSIKNYILRLLFLILFCSPLILIFIPDIKSEYFIIVKAAVLPVIVGYFLTHPFIVFVKKLARDDEIVRELEHDSSDGARSERIQEMEKELEAEEIESMKLNF